MNLNAARWGFRIVAVLLVVWTLVGVQGIVFAITDSELYVPGAAIWLFCEVALVYSAQRLRAATARPA